MDDGRIKQAATILQYKEQFLKALNPDDNPDFPPKLGDLAARLKAWRNTLQQALDESIDPVLKLEDETRGLMVGPPRQPPHIAMQYSLPFRNFSMSSTGR